MAKKTKKPQPTDVMDRVHELSKHPNIRLTREDIDYRKELCLEFRKPFRFTLSIQETKELNVRYKIDFGSPDECKRAIDTINLIEERHQFKSIE